jgi:Holliday junction resolvase
LFSSLSSASWLSSLTGASRGRQRERDVRRYLESPEGGDWFVVKAGGSLGDADLVALKAGRTPKIIEVKSTTAGPFHSFGPKDRAEILAAAGHAGAEAVLAFWPPRRELKFIPAADWP